jgi:hypothetical protein
VSKPAKRACFGQHWAFARCAPLQNKFEAIALLFSMAWAGQHGLSAVWLQATDFKSVVVDKLTFMRKFFYID